jgi:hypothetical protein
MSVLPEVRMLRQEDHKFKTHLSEKTKRKKPKTNQQKLNWTGLQGTAEITYITYFNSPNF